MWERGAAAYTASFAKVTGQATNTLLDSAGVNLTTAMAVSIVEKTPLESREGGLRVLDVATGPGVVADVAAARGHAEVVAVDFSAAMLKEAQPVVDKHGDIVKLIEGDAAALPLPDASFDAVVVSFGLLHLPDPQAALKEAARVLKPGGRLAYSVWEAPERGNAGFQILLDALTAHGNTDASLPTAAAGVEPLPFFHFASEANAKEALGAAGFDLASVRRETVQSSVALRDEHELYTLFATATARSRAMLEKQSEEQTAAVQAAMAERVLGGFSGNWHSGRGVMGTGGMDRIFPGTEEKLHVVKDHAATLGGAAAGTEWFGGRVMHVVPMPSVVVSAQKPAATTTKQTAKQPKKQPKKQTKETTAN